MKLFIFCREYNEITRRTFVIVANSIGQANKLLAKKLDVSIEKVKMDYTVDTKELNSGIIWEEDQ